MVRGVDADGDVCLWVQGIIFVEQGDLKGPGCASNP